MRIRKKPWAANELAINNHLIPAPEQYKGLWASYFGNARPIFLEIGCGMGGFIVKSALLHPENNYLALERVRMVIISGMRRAREDNISNIGFINTDADNLDTIFAPGEISGIFINFCDPWDRKKKWIKKRLTHERYLAVYKKILAVGAGVILKTDNINLFEYSIKSFETNGFITEDICYDLANSGVRDNITTEYEQKFMKDNKPIYRLCARL